MRHIRRFFESIHNLIRWFPVIWKDKDWDYSFLYTIMMVKIRHMRQRTEKVKFYEGYEIDAKWMRVCETLIKNINQGTYWLDKYDSAPINFKNIDVPQEKISMAQVRICQEDGDFCKEGDDLGAGHRAELRDIKARKLLFKILEWRINYWWD